MRDGVLPFTKALGLRGDEDGEGGFTYSQHMEGAQFLMPSPLVLANVVDQLDGIDIADALTSTRKAAPRSGLLLF